MKRSKLIGLGMLAATLISLFFSCRNNTNSPQEELVEATVEIACSQFTEGEKSVSPSATELTIASYHVMASGPAVSQPLDITATTSPVSLGKIAIGTWVINVEAKNSVGNILATGTKTQLFSPKTTSASLSLETLPGTGRINLDFTWPTDQVSSDAYLTFSLSNQNGDSVAIEAAEMSRGSNGKASLNKALPAGSYVLSVQLYSDTVAVAGSTIAIRIIENTTSKASVAMVIGDMSNQFSLTVTNNTSLPVQGDITCSPANPTVSTPFTLTFAPTNLAQAGLAEANLTYKWYCEGVVIAGATTKTLTVSKPLPGGHRYDLIISSNKLGSVGSVSMLVSVPVSSSIN